jgi:hypothetical protein
MGIFKYLTPRSAGALRQSADATRTAEVEENRPAGATKESKACSEGRFRLRRALLWCAAIGQGGQMLDRRRALRLGAAVVALGCLLPMAATRAQQAFQRFLPFLIDLDGWQGKKPDGVAMEMTGSSMITATRDYERGAARFHAQILIGAAARGALAVTQTGMKIETSEGRMNTANIDGFQVTRTFNFKDKSGAILVALGPASVFSTSFTGISDDEALTLAKKFDWKAIQAAAK